MLNTVNTMVMVSMVATVTVTKAAVLLKPMQNQATKRIQKSNLTFVGIRISLFRIPSFL